jgi:DNA-directed RNA polymerase subunit M/transcription elongation factor TFIIS
MRTKFEQWLDLGQADISSLESACWEHASQCFQKAMGVTTGHDESTYMQCCASAISNLTQDPDLSNGNAYLIKAVHDKSADVSSVPSMDVHDLDPVTYPRVQEARIQAHSDAFECAKCKARKTVHYELQTRSADEATTIFVTCVVCKNRWTE